MKKRMQKLFALSAGGYLLLILVALSMAGCGTGLSRNKAKEIITKHFKYPRPTILRIPIGIVEEDQFDLDGINGIKWLSILQNKGLIFLDAWLPTTNAIGMPTRFTGVIPTAEGKKYIVDENDEIFDKNGRRVDKYADVRMAQEAFLDVTGIKLSGDNKKAVVEFTYQYLNPTPFGKDTKYDDTKPKNAKVTLNLYDDGWRVGDESQIEYESQSEKR